MGWYCITLTQDETAAGTQLKIQDEFMRLFMDANAPREAAIFGSNPMTRKTPGVTIYFSPGSVAFAEQLITKYGGKPCEKPPRDVALYGGHADAGAELIGPQPSAMDTFRVS